MTIPAFNAPAPQWTRTYRVFSAVSATVLIGAVALAPFAAVVLPERAYAAHAYDGGDQRLAAGVAGEAPLDLSLSVLEDASEREAEAANAANASSSALYSLEQFMSRGVVNWGGYRFTYYSQQVLPGGGLAIPGRHVNESGYVSDADGYIVLAGSAPKGTVYDTPFGHRGKIYDRGTFGNHLDVYIR